ncbi:MAG: DUF1553 domain-containing protein [Verrucomicrobiales bacterium]|nr:DUF1553 domain-containing protein [Verrucomicrobiales bacterium]
MSWWRSIRTITIYWALFLYISGVAFAVDFATDVQPVLEQHCFSCHGPEKQKSGFRLDLRAAALRGGNEGPAIVPGKPDVSPLITYINLARDDDKAMPPKGSGLSKSEIATLTEWISEGSKWPDEHAGKDERLSHWSLQPLSPRRDLAESNRTPVDFFIEKKLDSTGYSPPLYPVRSGTQQGTVATKLSLRADRRTLIRRLSFDLHGLPPAREKVAEFVNDPDPNAYRKLVDEMLASPYFGERFARHWLDIAHYADTHGFERDKRRPVAWRYRDYVIDAFNQDKPYDRFIREQIAGDVLYPQDEAATIATGFLAAGPWDFVGHVETKSPLLKRAARALDLDDMTTQVMTATLGMTVNCARCHDHKLDPVSQEEYYQLTAVFAGVTREERVTSDELFQKYEKEKAELIKRRNRIAHRTGRLRGEGIDLADIVGGGNGHGTGTYGNGIDPRNAVVQTRKFGPLGNVKVNTFAKSKFHFVDGVFVVDGKGGETDIQLNSAGTKIRGIPATGGRAWDHIRNGPLASQHSTELGGIDFAKDGHSLLGIHANAGITFDLNAIRDASGERVLRFTSQVGYFGSPGDNRADVWIYIDGERVKNFTHLTRADGLKPVDISLPESARFLTLFATDGGNGYGNDQIGFGDPRLFPDVPREISEAEKAELSRLQDEANQIDKKVAGMGTPPKFYGVVPLQDMPEVRLQRRGDPESEAGEALSPGALSALAMLEPDLGGPETSAADRRKALAEWITDAKNPLTARVIVNRVWYWLFGQGIVDTPGDFGLGGGRPSHPELLDWLATELIAQNWSLKSLIRTILSSDTYCQTSRYESDHPGIAFDAGNRYLWRQNPARIEAEALRDSVLLVSGKLNPERGGPGFEDFTYKEAYAPEYTYITADEPNLWRRSIYRYIVRTTPSAFLTTLDCPDPANITPKRNITTTPLQSLALMNNEFMLKQAAYFAERVRSEAGDLPEAQVTRAFQHALCRSPEQNELDAAVTFVGREGLFAFCRALFNANEFVYVD